MSIAQQPTEVSESGSTVGDNMTRFTIPSESDKKSHLYKQQMALIRRIHQWVIKLQEIKREKEEAKASDIIEISSDSGNQEEQDNSKLPKLNAIDGIKGRLNHLSIVSLIFVMVIRY